METREAAQANQQTFVRLRDADIRDRPQRRETRIVAEIRMNADEHATPGSLVGDGKRGGAVVEGDVVQIEHQNAAEFERADLARVLAEFDVAERKCGGAFQFIGGNVGIQNLSHGVSPRMPRRAHPAGEASRWVNCVLRDLKGTPGEKNRM